MLDVESGRIVEDATIVVEDGLISAVNPATVPEGRVLDLGDRTLLPGLMDAHVHLAIDGAGFGPKILSHNAASAALIGADSARRTLMAGFTTVRDLAQVHPTLDLVTVALAEATERGTVPGPHIIAVGHALSISGGHIDPAMFMSAAEGVLDLGPEHGVADGIDEVLKATRYQIKHGAGAIKISATAGVMSLEKSVGAQQYTEEEMRTVVEEAARHGLKVAAHAHGTQGINAAIRAGVASIEHGSLLDDESIRLMKERGTYLVATTALADGMNVDGLPSTIVAKVEYVMPRAKESIRRAVQEGVKMAMGSDAPLVPHGENAREILALANRGMTPIEAIRSATTHAADLLDVPDRGRIAEGLRADLIAVAGDPLEDLAALLEVELVVKAGTVYKQP
jgi:imidazolonepropionase-like amidohydrolase